MSDQNSFLTADQNSLLAALPEITENQVITGFDTFAAAEFCTPSYLGCKACIGANVVGGFVTLSVRATTPFGGFSKSFRITNNVSFSWNPVGVFKIEFKVTNFRKSGGRFSFKLTIRLCIKVPIWGWKCKSFSRSFSIPTLIPSAQQSILSAKADDDEFDVDNQEYSTLLLLHAMLEKEDECSCQDD